MRKPALYLILLLIILPVVGCQTPKTNQDDAVTNAVKTKLASDTTLVSAGIDVITAQGVVTLRGTVIGQEESDRAVRLARSVPGVKAVHSELKVDTHITNEDVEKRLSNQESANNKKEEQKNQPDAKTFAQDADLTTKVKLTLAKDNLLSTYRIDVDTSNGVVTLTGTVKDEAEARRAVQLAESVENVKRVVSVLKLKK